MLLGVAFVLKLLNTILTVAVASMVLVSAMVLLIRVRIENAIKNRFERLKHALILLITKQERTLYVNSESVKFFFTLTLNLTINIMNKNESKASFFERFAASVSKAAGSNPAIIFAFAAVVIWAACGPVFHYSEDWQMVINTGTTIITFLMVFLIQKSQNKESIAVQLKLNELVAAHEFASNRLVDVENMTEEELKTIQKYYSQLKIKTTSEKSLQQSHSIDEAEAMHELKKDIEEDVKQKVKTQIMAVLILP